MWYNENSIPMRAECDALGTFTSVRAESDAMQWELLNPNDLFRHGYEN